jgi:hypothetical protein
MATVTNATRAPALATASSKCQLLFLSHTAECILINTVSNTTLTDTSYVSLQMMEPLKVK